MKIQAAVVHTAHGPFVIEDIKLDPPRADEVLVELTATGICHTDVAIVEQLLPLPLPFVLGHEGSGVVVAVGDAVTHVARGDHVVLTFGSCGVCRSCGHGRPATCLAQAEFNFAGRRSDGTPTAYHADGRPLNAAFFGQSSFATHAVCPARNVIKVRKDAPLELLGPLGCGFMTGAGSVLNVLKPSEDSTFVIVGAGAVGFAALFAAKLLGVQRIVAVDRVASRLDLARALGANAAIDTRTSDLQTALTGMGGADFVLDTTGVPRLIEAVIRSLNIGGQLALTGASADNVVSFELMHVLRGRGIRGVMEGDANPAVFIPFLVERFLEGTFPLDAVIEFFPFRAINDAVEAGVSGRAIKPILRF